jgi:hypothetical protein
VDIYDELERLIPAERRDAFLRLSREIKEYGDHNPELLRLVEVMGFLSLYTHDLPKRIAIEIERGVSAFQAASAVACPRMYPATTLPDATKTRAASEDSLKAAQAVATELRTLKRQMPAFGRPRWLLIACLGLIYFAGGAWFVWNDHQNVQRTIYERVAARTKDAVERLKPGYIQNHFDNLKALLDTGVRITVEHDSVSGDTVLFLQGANGASLYHPRYADGKYAINVLQ